MLLGSLWILSALNSKCEKMHTWKIIDHMKWDGRLIRTGVGCVFAVEEGESELMFWDDVTGKMLPPALVKKARQEELE